MSARVLLTKWVDNGYPTGDLSVMPESEQHNQVRNDVQAMLRAHFAPRPDVYVAGDMIVAYAEPDRRRHLCPDVFVVIGVNNFPRGNYAIWEEGVAPQFVLEVVSRTTLRNDLGRKRTIYQDVMRVHEYILFDPNYPSILFPPFQGFRLVNGEYQPIEPNANSRLYSEVLGLEFGIHWDRMRIWDPTTQTRLLTFSEQAAVEGQRADQLQQQARDETRRANNAELRLALLEAELQRLRGQAPPPSNQGGT
jgi:Uma2 family endonuclease